MMSSFDRAGVEELKTFKLRQQSDRKGEHDAAQAEDIGPPAPYPVGGPYLPELDGEVVHAMCLRYVSPVRSKRFGKKAKPTFILWFEIISDGYEGEGIEAPCYFPMQDDPRARASESSKYGRAYIIANEGRPGRSEAQSYKRFLSSVFKVELRIVKEGRGRNGKKRKLTPEQQYLVVENIVALVARGAKSR